MNNWNKTIKDLRGSLGESQEDFAKRLNTTQFTICRWENGQQVPSRMAQKLIMQLVNKTK